MKKHFTLKRFLTAAMVLSMVSISLISITNTGGPPAGYSNAPSESNCTTCHSGSLVTSGTNYNNISLSGNFTGSGYIPDSTYTIELEYSQTGKTKFGYQLTCLTSANAMAGSFAVISGNSKSSIISGSFGGGTRSYMRQTSAGTAATSGAQTWSFNWTAPSSNVGPIKFYTVVNSTNSSNTNASDVIIAKEFSFSPSTLLPVASASASNANPCKGSVVNLSGSGTNTPTSYNWSLVGANPGTSTSQNPSVVYPNQGTYRAILTVTNAKGVSQPDTVVISVKPTPTAFIGGGATRTLCQGDSLELTSTFESGNVYTWSNGKTGNSIFVKDTGDYTVSVQGSNGCGRLSNSVRVNYYTKPTASLTSNASAYNDSSCTDVTLNLQASSAAFDSFFYYIDGTLYASSDSATQAVPFTATTVLGLQVKNATGCYSDITNYTVTARNRAEAPIIKCTATTPSSIEFSFSSVFSHNGFQISTNGSSWSTPNSGASGNTHLVSGLQPEDSVTLFVRSRDMAPCDFSLVGQKKCFTEACTQLEPTVTFADSICRGDVWRVEVNGLANEFFSLSIDNGATFTDTIFEFNPLVSKTYTLNVIDSNSAICPANEIPLQVVVDNINDIELKTDKLGAYCPGETIIFSANDSIENFDFYYNNVLQQSGATNTYSNTGGANGDSVFVIVTKGQCTDTSLKNYVQLEIAPDASFTFARAQSVYTFIPTNGTFEEYTWDFGDGSALSTDVSPTHDYADVEGTTVNASLEIVTSNNCVYDSSQAIALPVFSSVADLIALGLEVYPNPTTDVVYINNEGNRPMQLTVISLSGEVVLQAANATKSLDVSKLSAGVYILKVRIGNEEASVRLLKN